MRPGLFIKKELTLSFILTPTPTSHSCPFCVPYHRYDSILLLLFSYLLNTAITASHCRFSCTDSEKKKRPNFSQDTLVFNRANHLNYRETYVKQFQTRERRRQPDFLPPVTCRPSLASSLVAAYLTATPPRQSREFIVD